MNEVLLKIAERVEPSDLLVYAIILGLFFLLWRGSNILQKLTQEINENGKDLAGIAELLRILTTSRHFDEKNH